jgi:hypothetical protein
MPASIRRILNLTLIAFTLATGALGSPGLRAQTPDLLDEARRLNQVATQQFEADIRLALTETARLAETDKSKAIEQYQALVKKIQNATAVSDERKATLVRVVQDRIRIAEAAAASDAETANERKAREAIEKLQKLNADKDAEERGKVKTGLDAVAALRKEGKSAEASKQAKELLKNHPDDLAVQVLNGISWTGSQIDDAKAVQTERDDRRVLAMRDMDRSAIPPIGDIEFPKDWKEKTARRLKSQQLSPTELRTLQALAQPISVEFKGSRLQDVVDYLSTVTSMTIMIDKAALDENQLSYDTPVSFTLKNKVATRTALRAILNQLGLTYVVRDNVIQITSIVRARDTMVTKSYYIGDIVAVSGLFGGSTQYGMALDQAQLAQNVGGIVEMITGSLDPMSWQGKGGVGTIGFNIPTMSLIVRQSAEVHMMMRGQFYK